MPPMSKSETVHCCGSESPQPLFYGRLLRVTSGAAALGAAAMLSTEVLGGWGFAGLVFLGLSFIVSGFSGTAGCEVTAIPNLVLPAGRKLTCFCPLWTPFDKIEHRYKSHRDEITSPR